MNTRRDFLKLASLAGAGRFGAMNALAQGTDYKALVCIFLFGGCDANNVVVPQASSDYTAYKTIRGSVGLPDNSATLLPVTAANGTPYALSSGFQAIHPLWAQGSLAAVANVGMLVQPTTPAQFLSGAVPVPTNLFSHSYQIIQMQAGTPNSFGGSGWAGRVADQVASMNQGVSFPSSISMDGPQLFCRGNAVQSASLIPGFDMQPTDSMYGRTQRRKRARKVCRKCSRSIAASPWSRPQTKSARTPLHSAPCSRICNRAPR